MESTNNIKEESLKLNYIISGVIITSFFIFVSGYYLGKKNGFESVNIQQNNQLLSDKIQYSFFKNKITQITKEEENPAEIETENCKKQEKLFYAELAGFGSIQAAKTCMNQLKQKGFIAQLITRNSRTTNGKNKTWYQIISKTMSRNKIEEELKKCNNIIKISQVIIKKAE